MPRGDRTGPRGMGPMTGRQAGYCAGYHVPGFANRYFGGGFGGAIRGGGRGHRHMFYATGLPLWQRFGAWTAAPIAYPQPTPEQELEFLKNQAEYFQNALEDIKKRMDELEAK